MKKINLEEKSKSGGRARKAILISVIVIVILLGAIYVYLKESATKEFNRRIAELDYSFLETTKKQGERKEEGQKLSDFMDKFSDNPTKKDVKDYENIVNPILDKWISLDEELLALSKQREETMNWKNNNLSSSRNKLILDLEGKTKIEISINEEDLKFDKAKVAMSNKMLSQIEKMALMSDVFSRDLQSDYQLDKALEDAKDLSISDNLDDNSSIEINNYFPKTYEFFKKNNLVFLDSYSLLIALKDKDYYTAEKYSQNISQGSEDVDVFFASEEDEGRALQADINKKMIELNEGYINLFDRYKKEKLYKGILTGKDSFWGKNRLIADILGRAIIEDYYQYNNKQYLDLPDFEKLYTELKSKSLVKDYDFNHSDFSYKFVDKDNCSLGFKDELLGSNLNISFY